MSDLLRFFMKVEDVWEDFRRRVWPESGRVFPDGPPIRVPTSRTY